MPQDIDVSARSTADAATVYALVESGATWPTWTGLGSFELERPGEGAPEGVGAIRVFRTWPFTSREEIVERVPGRRLSYVLLSGMPLRGYRADVDLTPSAEGTTIRWHSTFDVTVPGTGWFWRLFLGRFIRDCVNGLAREAASRSHT
ncbi:SRPBCC family protein [Phytohabitans aurantiacus]|uniref:MxaD family protein n=1 Tax=Phytohabitans aurantiacus TaxID=3016789 RepID=A0ABQ5QR31_9ACTN|nr:SRPBCC family protein [Phytohabitans aurantiacus]GLH97075.1 MxaD family protein [Phytohabitans aurantiacus]